jgi:hypothetical protein
VRRDQNSKVGSLRLRLCAVVSSKRRSSTILGQIISAARSTKVSDCESIYPPRNSNFHLRHHHSDRHSEQQSRISLTLTACNQRCSCDPHPTSYNITPAQLAAVVTGLGVGLRNRFHERGSSLQLRDQTFGLC